MARAQGAQAGAKEDTVFLAITTLTTDLSQFFTDLTSAAGGGYELNSTRAQLTGSRSVSVRVDLLAAEADLVLAVHGPNAQTDATWAIGTDSSGFVIFVQNGATVFTSAAAVPAADVTISWAMRPNPDTTGASDAKISEAWIYNHDAAAIIEIAQVTHATPTSSASWTLSIGGWWDGASLTSRPATAPSKARVSRAFHPHPEQHEDWVGARPAYAGTADDGPEEPVGPIPVVSGMGDAGQWAGRHPWGYAAARDDQAKRRHWSFLLNEVYSDAAEMTATPAPTQWATAAPGSALYTMMLQYLRWVPVPAEATHAFVRVHIVSWVTAGDPVPVGVRVYALNRLPANNTIGQQPAPPLEGRYRQAVITVDHGSAAGTGQWLDLGYLSLPTFRENVLGWQDTIHLAVAYDVDPAGVSANDANARIKIDAVHARPVFRFVAGGLDP